MSAGNGYATRDQLFQAAKRRFKDVAVGDMKVRIRSLTEAEFAEIDSSNLDLRKGGFNPEGVRQSNARLLAATVCDGDGNLVFQRSDVPQIMGLDAGLVQRLIREVRDFCGLRESAEDSRKNFDTTTVADSHSNSCEQPEPVGATA